MSKFIETEDGSYVLSSEIVRVRNHGDLACTVTTRSGESYAVGQDASYVTQVAEFDGSVIPAHRGYSVIRATLSEDGEWQYELFPVVGWSKLPIDDDAHDELFRSKPIVAGVVKDTYAWDLVLPDGRVISKLRAVYKNIEEWFNSEKASRTGSKKEKNGSRKKRDIAIGDLEFKL
ncbi:MAG TPA: hypothetical protein VLZ74_10445 [Methylocella sp.]|nr:hypothetical protein [Methylocella sp.]